MDEERLEPSTTTFRLQSTAVPLARGLPQTAKQSRVPPANTRIRVQAPGVRQTSRESTEGAQVDLGRVSPAPAGHLGPCKLHSIHFTPGCSGLGSRPAGIRAHWLAPPDPVIDQELEQSLRQRLNRLLEEPGRLPPPGHPGYPVPQPEELLGNEADLARTDNPIRGSAQARANGASSRRSRHSQFRAR